MNNSQRVFNSTIHFELIKKAIQDKKDPHIAVASYLLDIPESQVSRAQREEMKRLNYHILYSPSYMRELYGDTWSIQ